MGSGRSRSPTRSARATGASARDRRRCRDEAVAALADAAPGFLGTSHRREGVRSVVRRIRTGLADLFSLPDGYEVLIGIGGSTLFWDAASFGLVERRSTHLVIGEFSSKFAAVTRAAPHLDDPQVCETRAGRASRAPRARRGRRLRVSAQRDVDRRDGAACTAPTADALVAGRRHVGRGRASASTPTTSTSTTSRRRSASRATAASGSRCCSPAAIERIERLARDALDARHARSRRSRSRTRDSTRRTTRRRWRRSSCSTTSCSGCSPTAASSSRRAGATRRPGRSTAGPTATSTPRRS